MRTPLLLRRLTATLGAAALAATALVAAATGPASGACTSIPANHDPNVIRIVHQVGLARGVSERVMLAGFEAGWVESHMNNLPCGDKDSLGVFQQRPSFGWGTPAQILNVEYASTQFFSRAQVEDRNCPACTAGQIAQRVQRSGFPDRYDQSEAKARALLAEARGAVAGPGPSGQAYLYADQQHFAARSTGGTLSNLSWSPSTGLVRPDWGGGTLVGDPVGFAHNGQQHVFARGTDNTLRHWWQSGTAAPGLDNWNTAGRVLSDPTGFAYGNQQHVFFRNPDGALEHRFYDTVSGQVAGGVWPGGAFTGNPYAFVHRDQQHIFGRRANGDLVHWYWWPGINPGVDNWGALGRVASDVTGFSTGNQHHIFYRSTDGTLEHRFFDDVSGQVAVDNWGGAFVGAASAYVHKNQQHVFARAANGDLVHWYWWPGIAVGRDNWGAVGRVAGDPSGFSTANQHHVFYRTPDGTLEHRLVNDANGQVSTDNWGGSLGPPA